MGRPVTLFTGQWADLPLTTLAEKAGSWGYEGLEVASWGDHLDVEKAATDPAYCASQKAILAEHGLNTWAISLALQGQLVLDPNDARSNSFAPAELADQPEKMREWGTRLMLMGPQAAKNLGVNVINKT